MGEAYDFCRLFVDGLGTSDDVELALLNTGHYGLDRSDLGADGVSIEVWRNKNGFVIGLDCPAGGAMDWLGWPVTIEVFRGHEDDVPDASMLAVLRILVGDLKALGGQVKVAADYAGQL